MTRLTRLFWQWLSDNFIIPKSNEYPLAGARVYFFDAGTNIQRHLWLDKAKTIPAQNPIHLDDKGRVAEMAYFAE